MLQGWSLPGKNIKQEKHKKVAEEEKRRLKELDFMCCPEYGIELIEIDHKGIKVDKRSECEGIWLGFGERERIPKPEKSRVDKLFSVFEK